VNRRSLGDASPIGSLKAGGLLEKTLGGEEKLAA
jgi:hypothetical protein